MPVTDAASLTPCRRPNKRQLANTLFGRRTIAQPTEFPLIGRQPVRVPSRSGTASAAERPRIVAPTLIELIRRLDRELSTPLLTRTTHQVVLTSAGAELLSRSKVTLDEAAAKATVRRVAEPISAG